MNNLSCNVMCHGKAILNNFILLVNPKQSLLSFFLNLNTISIRIEGVFITQ